MAVETRNVKGLLGKKLGMTQGWDENNKLVPITVVEAGENIITQIKTSDTDGYEAIQVAYGAIDPRKVDKPSTGHFEKAGTTPRRFLAEIRTSDVATYSVGQALGVDIFEVGSKVDVVGTSKGKGFAGVMKASRLLRYSLLTRCSQEPPQARFHWCRYHPGQGRKGQEDARPHGN